MAEAGDNNHHSTGSTSQPGPYLTLKPDNETRLVRFLPSKASEPIKIRLINVALDNMPRYTFVGHTLFHRDEHEETIICNDSVLPVARNMLRLLESLRRDDSNAANLYWLKDICIDPNSDVGPGDNDELLLVACMKADLAINWVGVEISDFTLRFLEQLAAIATRLSLIPETHGFLALLQDDHTITAEATLRYEKLYNEAISRLRAGVLGAPRREYSYALSFFRKNKSAEQALSSGFDEQEAFAEIARLCNAGYFAIKCVSLDILVPRYMILRCGTTDIPWDVFSVALYGLVMYHLHAELKSSEMGKIMASVHLRARYLQSSLLTIEIVLAAPGWDLDTNYLQEYASELLASLSFLNERESPERRKGWPLTAGDEDCPDFCKLIVECVRGPLFLSMAGLPEDPRSRDECGSWIPNFELSKERLLLAHPNSDFSASSGTFQLIINDDYGLQCCGNIIDSVARVAGYLAPRRVCDQYDINGDNLFECIRWHKFAQSAEPATRPYQADALLLRFVETIQAWGCNHIWENREPRDPTLVMRQARSFLKFLEDPEASATMGHRLFYAACLPSHGRRFGVTEAGRFCLLPFSATRGDLVCIIKGFKVPLIVRKQGDRHRNVGESYVHGIMYGEVEGNETSIVLM